MRLIDADKLIYQSNTQHLQPYINKKDIDEQPTVEMAEDCISREEAINELKLAYFNKDLQSAKDDPCIVDAMTDWAIRTIKNLPSVQPQPKRGKWIHREDMDYLDKNKVIHNHFMCQNCGFVHDFIDGHTAQYKYCPSCGEDMREVQG